MLLWAKFINAETKEEFDILSEKNPYIKEAYETLQEISQDREAYLAYIASDKAIRDHNYLMAEADRRGLQRGIEIGREQEIESTAKNLIQLGAATDFIAAATNLSPERIQALRKECSQS